MTVDVVILTGVFGDEYQTSKSKPIGRDTGANPHYRTAGAYQIAHHLREHNISVQVIDFTQLMTTEQVLGYIRKFLHADKPCILGLSTSFMTFDADGSLHPILRDAVIQIRNERNVKIIAGGANAETALAGDREIIDFSIYSYSEDITLELFSGLLGKTKLDPKFKLTRRLFQDNVKFDVTQNSHRFVKEDCIRPNEALPLEIARGCIFKCRFCRYPYIGKKKNDYLRCIENIRDELVYNYENFGTTNYYILDDTFNETPAKVEEFYNMTQTLPFKIQYCAYIRADLVHRFPETAVWLRDSGLVAAFFGIESFHPVASKVVGKGWSGTHGKEFLKELKTGVWKDRVSITVSLIVGLPEETLEDMMSTNEWCHENDIDRWSWHVLTISASTDKTDSSEFEREPAKYGYVVSEGGNWHNGIIDRKTAAKWFQKLSVEDNSPRASSWRVVEGLNYFDLDTMLHYNTRVYRKALKEARAKWFDEYIALLDQI